MSTLDTAQKRLQDAVDRLDAAIRANPRLNGADSTALQEEVNSLRRENEALAQTRTQISSRLDSAITNIRTVLEA
jgi:predicted  nucleic acid-binding Zn-ribbon protein